MVGAVIAALSQVPWGTVIEKAPQVVETAGGLLARLRGTRTKLPLAPDENGAAALLGAHTAEITALRDELGQATQLIVDLSAAQAALVMQVRQLRAMAYGAVGLAVVSCIGGAIALLR